MGFTIIEVVVVPAILLLVVLAVMNAFGAYVRTSKGSVDTVKASYLLDEGIEVMKIFRDEGWEQKISTLPIDTPIKIFWNGSSFATTSSQVLIDDKFEQAIVLNNVYRDNLTKTISTSGTIDTNSRKVTVYVSWNTNMGTTTKSLSAYISNIFSN